MTKIVMACFTIAVAFVLKRKRDEKEIIPKAYNGHRNFEEEKEIADSFPVRNLPNEFVQIVDIGCWIRHDCSTNEKEKIISQIENASTTTGFFQLVYHGLEKSKNDAFDQAKTFFNLDESEKLKFTVDDVQQVRGYTPLAEASVDKMYHRQHPKPDAREVLSFGPFQGPISTQNPNIYPNENFQAVIKQLYLDALDLENALFQVFATSLKRMTKNQQPNVDENYFVNATKDHGILIRMNSYPNEGHGLSAHTDFGPFTILLADTPGFEILFQNRWNCIEHETGAIFVNVGDQLNVWSNGRFLSNPHQVKRRITTTTSTTKERRLSISIFPSGAINQLSTNQVIQPILAPGERQLIDSKSTKSFIQDRIDHYLSTMKS